MTLNNAATWYKYVTVRPLMNHQKRKVFLHMFRSNQLCCKSSLAKSIQVLNGMHNIRRKQESWDRRFHWPAYKRLKSTSLIGFSSIAVRNRRAKSVKKYLKLIVGAEQDSAVAKEANLWRSLMCKSRRRRMSSANWSSSSLK